MKANLFFNTLLWGILISLPIATTWAGEQKFNDQGMETFPSRICIMGKKLSPQCSGPSCPHAISCLKTVNEDPNKKDNWNPLALDTQTHSGQNISMSADISGRFCKMYEGSDGHLWPGCTQDYSKNPDSFTTKDKLNIITNWHTSKAISGDNTDNMDMAADGYGRWCVSHSGDKENDIWLNCNDDSKSTLDPMYVTNWFHNYIILKDNDNKLTVDNSLATDGVRWCVAISTELHKVVIACNEAGKNPHCNWTCSMDKWSKVPISPTIEANGVPALATDGKRWCLAFTQFKDKTLSIACTKDMNPDWSDTQIHQVGKEKYASSRYLDLATDGMRWCIHSGGAKEDLGKVRCTDPGTDPTVSSNWPRPDIFANSGISRNKIAMNKSCMAAGDKTNQSSTCCQGLELKDGLCQAKVEIPTIQSSLSLGKSSVITPQTENGFCDSKVSSALEKDHKNASYGLFKVFTTFNSFQPATTVKTTTDLLIELSRQYKEEVDTIFATFDKKIAINKEGILLLSERIPNAQDKEEEQTLIKEFFDLNIVVDNETVKGDVVDSQRSILLIQKNNHQLNSNLYTGLSRIYHSVLEKLTNDIAPVSANEEWNCENASLKLCRPWKIFDIQESQYFIAPPIIPNKGDPILKNLNLEDIEKYNKLGNIRAIDTATDPAWKNMTDYLVKELNGKVDRITGIRVHQGPDMVAGPKQKTFANTLVNNEKLAKELSVMIKEISSLSHDSTSKTWNYKKHETIIEMIKNLMVEIQFLMAAQEVENNKIKCIDKILGKYKPAYSTSGYSTSGYSSSGSRD